MPDWSRLLDELYAAEEAAAEGLAQQAARLLDPAAEIPAELAAWLTSPSAEQRWWGVYILAGSRHPGAAPALAQALADADPTVRQAALLGLRACPHPPAAATLLALLASPDELSGRLAGEALAALGEAVIPPLAEVLQHGEGRAPLQAARALALMEHPAAIPALFHALEHPSQIVQYWANEGLERLGVGMAFFNPGN